jgi:hypothetical protein
MSLDFMNWTRFVPGIQIFWQNIANQVCCGLCAVTVPLLRCCQTGSVLSVQSGAGPDLLLLHLICAWVQVLGEDLVLVSGQQDRMQRGADTWAHPVSYDKLVRTPPA